MVDSRTYLRSWGWVDAVKKAEKSGDLQPLACLLRLGAPMEKATRLLLAELFDRHRLGRKRGRPRSSDLALLARIDLAPFARLLRSDTSMEPATRIRLAELFDRRRLVRKRGRPRSLFRMSARDRYADAAKAVKQVRQVMKVWEDVRKKDSTFVKRVRSELGAKFIKPAADPVDFVAKGLSLDADKLANVVQGKTGFGRKAKPEPKPGSADK
jgi:hypothetical protein